MFPTVKPTPLHYTLLIILLAAYIWSAIAPHDYFTWFLESFYIFPVLPLLILTFKKFPLTPLLYILITAHLILLFVGGHYTYANVPLGNWFKHAFHLSRNHYDRLGHFAQGFVPALLVREILIRKNILTPRHPFWQFFIVTCICLAFSAAFEEFEYAVSISTGAKADAFLATQGDPWDTQNDMLCALVGAIVAQLLLTRIHNQQLARAPHDLHHDA